MLFRKWLKQPRSLARLLRFYCPYIGAGIRVQHIADGWSSASVSMPLRWYNRNFVGTHFGGSLFSMTDPFAMILLMQRLGPGYIVWDKRASIDFVRPGKGRVHVNFELPDAVVESVRTHAADGEPHLEDFTLDVMDDAGELVARVIKTVYVRQKPARNGQT